MGFMAEDGLNLVLFSPRLHLQATVLAVYDIKQLFN